MRYRFAIDMSPAEGTQTMKTLALGLTLLFTPLSAEAKTMTDTDLSHRIQTLEDRAALKALVDTFSNLADVKDIDRQVLLFTPDATVDSIWTASRPRRSKAADRSARCSGASWASSAPSIT
jgi:hypothetical protein